MASSCGYRQVEHTADLALEVWGSTHEEMLATGARALVDLLTEGAQLEPDAEREIKIDAVDQDDALVQWLGEVLFLAQVEGFVVANAHLEVSADGLRGRVVGQNAATALLRTEIKSVTYHDVHIQTAPGRVSAIVVLDV